ncbi:MAG: PKD domain-containing protein [Bacteroidales bacterium]|nr:PKD domain-containing protein [Bacteroidales bacterium]
MIKKIQLPIYLLIFISYLLIFTYTHVNAQSGCPNADFSMGDFTGWTGYTGTYGSCCPTAGIVNGRHTIISTPGTDPRTGSMLQMIPPGAAFSAKLGNEQVGAQAERLRYTINVSPQNNLFIYKYAVVMEDPGHSSSEQPKFTIRVLNAAGSLVDPTCGFYSVVSSGSIPGFQNAPGSIRWKNWTTVGIDLTAYMGQNITIEYTTYDCDQGGHYGYAYIACSCAPMQISVGYCQGSNNVVMQAPAGFATYAWSPGGYTTQTVTLNNPTIGQTYSCVMTAPNGCQAVLNAVIQPTVITPDFTITSPLCSFNASFQDNSTVNQGSVDTWLWNFGDGTTSTLQNPSHTYTSPGTYTVTLTAGSVGCTTSTTQTLNVFPSPVANAGTNQTICIGQSANLTASGGVTFQWSNNVNTPNNNVTPNVTSTYTVTVSDANGCSDTDDVVVTVNSLPVANAGTDTSICYGTSANIQASGGTSYFWSPSTGLSASNVSNPIATPLATTNYMLSVTDVNGCMNTDNVIITVMNLPPANAGANQSICEGQSATLTASGGTDYSWNTGDITSTIVVSPIVSTTYTLTVTDVNGCSATDDVVVNMNPPPPAYAGDDVFICSGLSTNLNATGGLTYQWSPATGLNATNVHNPIANPTTPITYTVTVTDGAGCSATDQVIVGVYPSPVVNFSALPLNGCEPLSVQFVDNSAPSIHFWSWEFGDPTSTDNISTQQNPIHVYQTPGVYTVSLFVATTDNCEGVLTVPQMIEVYPNPVAEFSLSPSVTDEENALIFFYDESVLASVWHWDFGNSSSGTQNTSNSQSTSHYYTSEGTYTISLMVESVHGCVDSTSKEVIIKPSFTFYIPNVFTPDGDNINDYFQGFGTNIVEYSMMIFNRWGEMLYETDDYNIPWDGKSLNASEVCMQDVYVYRIVILDINGKVHKYYGHVTLLK